MEIKQETKSLPRNRKCGNCRYFEPAPLWRKGWCRNPRLYDRRANHLVDAATIDCEQVFRARIYWEPVPTSDTVEVGVGFSPFVGHSAADSGAQADGGQGRLPGDGVLRSRTAVSAPPVNPALSENLPVITRREKAAASPGLVAKPSPVRRWLVENIPYYDKIDGPISRINVIKVLPWIVVVALLLVVLLNVVGGRKDGTTATTTTTTTATSTLVVGNSTPNPARQTTAAVVNPNPNITPASPPTPTLSNVVPTATPTSPPAPTVRATETLATVINAPQGLKLRKEPNNKNGDANVLKTVPQGAKVKILSGDYRTIEGLTWWPVSHDGTEGWVASTYLEADKPKP